MNHEVLRYAIALCLLVTAASGSARAYFSYGDRLVQQILTAHHDVTAVEIRATTKDGVAIVIFRGALDPANAETAALANSMGDQIGTLIVGAHKGRTTMARQIASEVSRKIYVADNLIEPDPFVPGAKRSTLGQRIVDEMMADNSDLVTLGMHVGKSGAANVMLATNFGRIGKAGDKDDARVIDGGETLVEATSGGRRLAIALPMLDRRGRVIGALSTSFIAGPRGREGATQRAVDVRNAIARRIGSFNDLLR